MNELVLAGHSFGGQTALIAACKLDKPIKAVVVMDPWLWAFETEFKSGELKVPCPVQIVSSETFHPSEKFDSWGTVLNILKYAKQAN